MSGNNGSRNDRRSVGDEPAVPPLSAAASSRRRARVAAAQQEPLPSTPIPELLEELRAGRMVVMCDDENRENEGDLFLAAEHVTTEKMGFLIRHTGGVVCLSLTGERVEELGLPLMVAQNTTRRGTNFTVSIDAAEGTTTGISAADRTRTVRVAVDPTAKPSALLRPGHVFPLRGAEGGVLERPGHTEAVLDLCRLAGLAPAGLVSEIMDDEGNMLRGERLVEFCRTHGLKLGHIQDLVEYRRLTEPLVERVSSARLPTAAGDFTVVGYRGLYDVQGPGEHLALIKGFAPPQTDEERAALASHEVLVRIHSECLTGDAMNSLRCDCGPQLDESLRQIAEAERGVLIYLRQEGRGIGLLEKIRAYALQDEGLDTVEANLHLGHQADERDFSVGVSILRDLGTTRVRVLTNNPGKLESLREAGLHVGERAPLQVDSNPHNHEYLLTKKRRLGHLLDVASGRHRNVRSGHSPPQAQ